MAQNSAAGENFQAFLLHFAAEASEASDDHLPLRGGGVGVHVQLYGATSVRVETPTVRSVSGICSLLLCGLVVYYVLNLLEARRVAACHFSAEAVEINRCPC